MISALFIASSLVVIVTPGPDAALITQTVLRSAGRRPALAAAAGMITAGAAHACLSITGVSLLLRTNSALFDALQLTGAAVLLAWGAWTLRESFRPADVGGAAMPEPGGRHSFAIGFLSTITNAKVAVFLLAFLPQFVPAGHPPAATMIVLAAVYLLLGAAWLLTLIALVHRLRHRILTPTTHRYLQRLLALVLGAFALRLILTL
jgi:threonine/homoserine/homoserine lactone efflux protein